MKSEFWLKQAYLGALRTLFRAVKRTYFKEMWKHKHTMWGDSKGSVMLYASYTGVKIIRELRKYAMVL